jgi:hypothetical protein
MKSEITHDGKTTTAFGRMIAGFMTSSDQVVETVFATVKNDTDRLSYFIADGRETKMMKNMAAMGTLSKLSGFLKEIVGTA